jgi:hypothetical protein
MLILFKPWRQITDLKAPGVSWRSAFESTVFTDRALEIMKNMNVENECRDARDTHNANRHSGKVKHNLMAGLDLAGPRAISRRLGYL